MITPRWLAWHAFTILAVVGMLWLGDWQFHRAVDGNALSWAYTFEWPVFSAFGIVFWIKTLIDEAKPKESVAPDGAQRAEAGTAGLPALAGRRAAGGGAGENDEAEKDPELDEYNAYLARLSQQVQGHGRWHGLR